AFQLNKCSDSNAKKSLLLNHKNYLKEECQENIARLGKAIEHAVSQTKTADSLLTEISKQKDLMRIRSLATQLLDLQNVSLKEDAFSVLVQSGDIRFMEDFEEKRKIISLYESFSSPRKANLNIQNLYDKHFYPYLKENFDLVNWNYLRFEEEKDKAAYYAGEFGNTISTYRFLLVAKIRAYQDCQENIKTLLTELSQEK
ncbi:MAG: hypothetical protein AAF696_15545, partial [Bacteroidota bacterium]